MTDTVLASLATDAATARRVSDYLGETLPPDDTACSAYETEGLAEPGDAWRVEVHFRDPPDEAAVRALVALAAGDAAAAALTFSHVAQQDWVAASLSGLTPVTAGRFVVHGSHDRAVMPDHKIAIEVEAALAFGTGHHGTTRGCLLALEHLARGRPPRRVLDVGTGSGVLAIAAARLWHVPVVASDIDSLAVTATQANARLNRVGPYVTALHAAGVTAATIRDRGPYDLIFANILLPPLRRMATPLSALLAADGHIVLSGLLPTDANAALNSYRAQGLTLTRRLPLDGWMTLLMRRA